MRAALRVDVDDVNVAIFRITKGLFKKVVLGDFVAANFTDLVFASPSQYSSLETLLALYAFTLQIYADFSGYSDMAIGVARLLGFKLPENFDRPYQSRDVGEAVGGRNRVGHDAPSLSWSSLCDATLLNPSLCGGLHEAAWLRGAASTGRRRSSNARGGGIVVKSAAKWREVE